MKTTPEIYCYLNGEIIPQRHAKISVLDIAVLRGYAVFDSMRAEGLKVFHLDDHLARFFNSAKVLGIKVPATKQHLKQTISELLKKNNFQRSKVRAVLTGGNLIGSLDFNPNKGNLIILVDPLDNFSNFIYSHGVKLITANFKRSISNVKTTSYAVAVNLQKKMKSQKAFEILYVDSGKVSECSTSNFFIIKNKTLISPKEGILKGVTRDLVIKLAKQKLKLKVVERDLFASEIRSAQEAFITGTYKGVIPVIRVENFKVSNGKVGPITKKIVRLYNDLKP